MLAAHLLPKDVEGWKQVFRNWMAFGNIAQAAYCMQKVAASAHQLPLELCVAGLQTGSERRRVAHDAFIAPCAAGMAHTQLPVVLGSPCGTGRHAGYSGKLSEGTGWV